MDFPGYVSKELYDLVEKLLSFNCQYWGIVSCTDMCILKYVPHDEECEVIVSSTLVNMFGPSCTVEIMEYTRPFDYFFHGYAQVLYKSDYVFVKDIIKEA